MLTSEKFKEKALSDPEARAEYEALEPEFALFDELLRARKRAGLTQAKIAERMDTKPPAAAVPAILLRWRRYDVMHRRSGAILKSGWWRKNPIDGLICKNRESYVKTFESPQHSGRFREDAAHHPRLGRLEARWF